MVYEKNSLQILKTIMLIKNRPDFNIEIKYGPFTTQKIVI